MDFLEKYEKKFLPSFHKQRYKKRLDDALALKDKALNSPQNLTWEELRTILRVLKHKKLLPNEDEANRREKEFVSASIGGLIPSIAFGFSPYLVKQFHKMNKKWMKRGIVGAISLITYTIIVQKPLNDLKEYSQKQAHYLAGFLHPDQE